MIIEKLDYDLSVCQVESLNDIPEIKGFCSITNTTDELSIVIETKYLFFKTINRENNFKAFRIKGVLDFSLIGILSKISSLLADNLISIFALSTYNTDYILVKKENFDKALDILKINGYTVI